MNTTNQTPSLEMPGLGVVLVGIILPIIALAVEITTGICAESFFDPIPTWMHIVLYASIAVSNFLTLNPVAWGLSGRLALLARINAFALGVSIFYTVLFLPLLPVSPFAMMFMGVGMCSLSPILALWATYRSRNFLKILSATKLPSMWTGLAAAICLLFLIELPSTVTRFAMSMAASSKSERSQHGIQLLRSWGDNDLMLDHCYRRPGRFTDLVSLILLANSDPVSSEEARKIYYKVTGVPFNSVPAPEYKRHRSSWDSFDFDEDQAGAAVGGLVKGLSLASSRIDGSVDPDAALTYTEWTLEFKNTGPGQAEARAQISLPPQGVVSRLTLWIGGEEREAAFAGRGKVRQAYEKVVQQRRDPVLVTTAGPDRVLMQCFPVPPGGSMKVRLGITSPLVLASKEKASLGLPHFLERNFQIGEGVLHSVWLESSKPLSSGSLTFKAEQPKRGVYALRDMVKDSELSSGRSAVWTERSGDITRAWARDRRSKQGGLVVETITEKRQIPAESVIVVVDGSKGMAPLIPALTEALKTTKPGASLILAGDDLAEVNGTPSELSERTAKFSFTGGQDNVPALLKALETAGSKPGGVIVWVHGAQPVTFASAELLRQAWERRPEGPLLKSYQPVNGPNRVLEGLDGIDAVTSIPNTGDVKRDLSELFTNLAGEQANFIITRAKAGHAPGGSSAKETSDHLVRLWARDEVLKLGKPKLKEAIRMATDYQIVTHVSGAVVLETQEQYKNGGLEAADPAKVPTIPEPETWLLLAVVLALCLWQYRTRKVTCV